MSNCLRDCLTTVYPVQDILSQLLSWRDVLRLRKTCKFFYTEISSTGALSHFLSHLEMSEPMPRQHESWSIESQEADSPDTPEKKTEKIIQQYLINGLSPKEALISLSLDGLHVKYQTLSSMSKHFPCLQILSLRGCPVISPPNQHVVFLEALKSFPQLRTVRVG